MGHRRKTGGFLLVTGALCCACVETIILDPKEELPVYVECILEGAEPRLKYAVQSLEMYYAKGKSADNYEIIDSARAYIIREYPHDTVEFFKRVSPTHWQFNRLLDPGKYYDLHIEIPGREPITSITRIPDNFRVATPYARLCVLKYDEYGSYVGQYLSAPDPHNLWIVAKRGAYREDESNDNNYPLLVTDNPYVDDFNVTGQKLSDLDFSGNPNKNYAGFWDLVQFRQQYYPDLPLHEGFLRIEWPADFTNGLTEEQRSEARRNVAFEDCVLMCGPLECPEGDQATTNPAYKNDHYEIFSLSEELDRYVRDVYVRSKSRGEDLTAVYSTDNIYSNIDGGIGIFGSFIRKFGNIYSNY